MGGTAAKGQSMVGGREVAQIKRARPVVRRTASRCPGGRPSTGSSRALDASRLDRGAGGGDRDTTGCIPLLLSLVLPPCAVTGGPEEKGVGVWECGSVGEGWEWVCCERGTKAEPLLLLLLLLHGKTAAGLPLLPLPALPALPLALDLVQAIIRVLGPCPERAFSAVDVVADAIVTLQYRRPQCSTPRGERMFWANYGPVLGQFWANSGVENNGSRGHYRESSRLSMCRAPAPVMSIAGRTVQPSKRPVLSNKHGLPAMPPATASSESRRKQHVFVTHPATHTTPGGDGRFVETVETDLAVQTSKALNPPASPARTNANHEEG